MNFSSMNKATSGAVIGFFIGISITRTFLGALILAGIGFVVGRAFNTSEHQQGNKLDYVKEILALVSVILTDDKKILQPELNFVKRFLKQNFSEEEAVKYLIIFRDFTKQNLSIEKICVRLNLNLNSSGKRQVLHLIIGAAVADRELSRGELRNLYTIGHYLNLNRQVVDALLSLHYFNFEGQTNRNQSGNNNRRPSQYKSSIKNAYQALEITENANDSEVKKAYRKLAVIYHPDKVAHMGDSLQKSAKNKFQKIQDAYEQIKTTRGMK